MITKSLLFLLIGHQLFPIGGRRLLVGYIEHRKSGMSGFGKYAFEFLCIVDTIVIYIYEYAFLLCLVEICLH